ncbi:hypothetical protein PHYBLDRAFT_68627 [Phycomyces blakesleeanus NRRL 1555(-)]|uniref:Uncharacterized protein n=1 Tax=Phycomyces blakesleeanus (strain ATCC 8743b / DSM 1359 / FGSC 10004 / NBRC 33097 / NRRL 1555) TaxID=763407 RepID=A0A163DLD0_PHYB8|nr:hypothetical protein PHYBLDRAFT_68627 [Phycomyces blakesleeanus NRRL 1555(-)]OAD72110.1 hypothetical protein PHYBLDRAFT_68627 [Phycomyces blakesleeanus NRRL 1555(-)]|eukprot:XP_018290150.1 hypothetical protein PHYBLDRAFT_68627 [Phycomyces blakesleeanus NRRL 1555(-)]
MLAKNGTIYGLVESTCHLPPENFVTLRLAKKQIGLASCTKKWNKGIVTNVAPKREGFHIKQEVFSLNEHSIRHNETAQILAGLIKPLTHACHLLFDKLAICAPSLRSKAFVSRSYVIYKLYDVDEQVLS